MESAASASSTSASSLPTPPPAPSGLGFEFPDSGSTAKPLKRGAACLACRKRKLRCSGDRPRCASCSKSRSECTYDEVIMSSRGRMKLLEQKIATLESFLVADGSATRPSFNGSSEDHPTVAVGDLPNPFVSPSSWQPQPQLLPPSSFSYTSTTGILDQESFSRALEELLGGGGILADSSMEGDLSFASPNSYPSSEPPPPHSYPTTSSVPSSISPPSLPPPRIFDTFPPTLQNNTPPLPSSPSFFGGLNLPAQDVTAIDPALRSHLLDLFFQRSRNFRLTLHVPRFLASLDGPPEDQPEQALLFAMYSCAARFSPFPEIQSLERPLVDASKKYIDLALRDRSANLLQIVQASTCLAFVLYSQASYVEGWVQAGVSLRLAAACQFNKIHTSSFDAYTSRFQTWPTKSFSLKRTPFTRLTPPRDGVELGERISAFWSAYMFDRISSTGPGWAHGIPDSEIETPWPRALYEYEKGIIEGLDESVEDLFSLDPVTPSGRIDGTEATLMKATALFHRAAHIGDQPTVRKAQQAGENSTAPIPQVLLDLERCLRRFVDALPPSASTMKVVGGIPPWNSNVPIGPLSFGVDPTVFSINSIIYATFMLLYEEFFLFEPSYREKSVQAARGGTALIAHCVDIDFGHLDVILPVLWKVYARLLLDEAKRLGELGLLEEASTCQIDVEVLVLSMRRMGQVWQVGDTQASVIEKMQLMSISKDGEVCEGG